ncbi:FAD-dependent monooxygenase [Streptomyces sp. HPF1205]|uniref:FAD-dependent monooxygenase n=1 Tax=Streptomyces sp. HPF1205 TaxID=2873262 RepID=UPI001CEDD096|nr:FAD-dependent monooxygenase [Streptomyces sp. HPF1205]
MADEAEVLVVGAGPTGLTLAAGLLQRGVRVRVIDQAERANPHSKAVILWPRALEALAALGVGEKMYDLGVKVMASSYYTGGQFLGRLAMRPLSGTRFPVAVSLPQTSTERLLREAVESRGGRIEFGSRLATLEQDEDGVLATLDNGKAVRASYVVGADGAHSTVRAQSGVPFEGATYPQTFILVDGEYDTDYKHDESYYLMGPTGVIVVLGLPDGLYRVFCSVPPGQPVDDVEATVRKIVAEHSPLKLEQVRATGSGTFQIHRRMAQRMRSGRLLLAGDAAHIHSPAGGLGLNTGVEDAHSLAWRLAGVLQGTLPESELDDWEAERLFVAKHVIAETDMQTQVWMLKGWQRQVRDVAIDLGLRSGLIERFLPRRLSQLDLVLPVEGPSAGVSRWAGTALPAAGPSARGLRPGLRIPDVPLDRDRHLHDLFRAGHHVLLVSGPDPRAELAALDLGEGLSRLETVLIATGPARPDTSGGVVDDITGHLRKALGAPPRALVLIRPDGIIAAAAEPADAVAASRLRSRLAALTAPALPRVPAPAAVPAPVPTPALEA